MFTHRGQVWAEPETLRCLGLLSKLGVSTVNPSRGFPLGYIARLRLVLCSRDLLSLAIARHNSGLRARTATNVGGHDVLRHPVGRGKANGLGRSPHDRTVHLQVFVMFKCRCAVLAVKACYVVALVRSWG